MKPLILLFCWWIVAACSAATPGGELRMGLVGLDTSHCVNWAAILNDPQHRDHVPGARIVAAYKGGSYDIPHSFNRVDEFTREMQEKWGVALVSTIEELCARVDVVAVTSGDGRTHLAQARKVIQAGKPLFVDKPMAGTLAEAMEIFRLAEKHGVPIFSASGRRFGYGGPGKLDPNVGEIVGADSVGPAQLEPHHQDLFWYGIHPTEALFVYMGEDCEKVVRVHTPDTDVVVGVWSGGRVGTLRGVRRGGREYLMRVFGTKKTVEIKLEGRGHPDTLRAMIQFFRTGVAPVKPEQTLAIIAFMEAADESKRQLGREVYIKDVMARAMTQLPPDPQPQQRGAAASSTR